MIRADASPVTMDNGYKIITTAIPACATRVLACRDPQDTLPSFPTPVMPAEQRNA